MTKGVKICLAAVIALFIAVATASYFILRPSESTMVEIVQDNKVLYTFDLSKEPNRTFRIDYSGGGWNEITIENGQITVSDADCPDKTCVKTGVLRSETIPIVCLPHKLIVRFCDGEGS
ncbi:MAG: NusG domain II-containing protein [Ruminococcus sp.]|nr:NusG domain II-containing protein [Ruminococcus sp.]